jgi:aminopeptidase N
MKNSAGDEEIRTLRHAFERDSSYAVTTAALRSLISADSAHAREVLRRALGMDSQNETIRAAALTALGASSDEESYALVRPYARYGVDRGLRVLALTILGRTWKDRPEVLELLMTSASDGLVPVRRVAVDLLGQIGNPAALPVLDARVAAETHEATRAAARDAAGKIRAAQH